MAKRTYNTEDLSNNDTSVSDIINDDIHDEHKTEKSTVRKSKSGFNIVTGLISIGLLMGSIFFGYKFLQEENKHISVIKLWDNIKDIANETETSTDGSSKDNVSSESAYSTDPIDREINWIDLCKINSDVTCWMYIPDTQIDYPVLQEPRYGEYFYLRRDIYKKEFISGSLFIPKLPDGYTEDAHLLIFGHNMRNGTMFSTLLEYKSNKFYTDHPYIYMYYPDRTEKWEVWSAYHTSQNDIVYHIPYELGTEEYVNLLNSIDSKKSYTTSIKDVTSDTNILSLSTCDKTDNESGRFVLNAVMVDVKYIN